MWLQETCSACRVQVEGTHLAISSPAPPRIRGRPAGNSAHERVAFRGRLARPATGAGGRHDSFAPSWPWLPVKPLDFASRSSQESRRLLYIVPAQLNDE